MGNNEISIALVTPGFDKTQSAFDKLNRKQKELILSGSEIGRQYERMKAKIDGVGNSAKKAGRYQQDGFGSRAISDLKSMALGYIGVSAAVGLVRAGLQGVVAEQERAKAAVASSAGDAKFGQIAKTPEDVAKLIGLRKAVAREEGIMDDSVARDFVFGLASVGALDQREYLQKLFRIMPEGGGMVAEGAVGLRKSFGADAGTVSQLTNMILAGASSSKTSAAEFAPGVIRTTSSAQSIGATAEETIGLLSPMVMLAGNPEVASTELSAFATALNAKGIDTGGFIENAKKIEAMNLSVEELNGHLGNIRAIRGYHHIIAAASEGDAQAAIADTKRAKAATGTKDDDLIAREKAVMAQPGIAADHERRVAAVKLKQGEEEAFGVGDTERETLVDEIKRGNVNQMMGVNRWMAGVQATAAAKLRLPEGVIRTAGDAPFLGLGYLAEGAKAYWDNPQEFKQTILGAPKNLYRDVVGIGPRPRDTKVVSVEDYNAGQAAIEALLRLKDGEGPTMGKSRAIAREVLGEALKDRSFRLDDESIEKLAAALRAASTPAQAPTKPVQHIPTE